MGDSGVDDISGHEAAKPFVAAPLLGSPAGENRHHRAVSGFKAGDHKADRLVDPRDDSDVAGGAFPNSERPFLPWDDAAQPFPKLDDQVVGGIADHRLPLKDIL